ncbi:MAG: hypothetical protein JEZ08_13430 [Clostridiales bacterium]|nr:hypothetical protein [Clostridiales bacterium]
MHYLACFGAVMIVDQHSNCHCCSGIIIKNLKTTYRVFSRSHDFSGTIDGI